MKLGAPLTSHIPPFAVCIQRSKLARTGKNARTKWMETIINLNPIIADLRITITPVVASPLQGESKCTQWKN